MYQKCIQLINNRSSIFGQVDEEYFEEVGIYRDFERRIVV